MIFIEKNVGETPLELLNRIRRERPELAGEKLSYAGRLDPMAEGQMLILVGDEENKKRQKFLGLDKEYIATFLMGVATDTGDILGLIDKSVETKNFQNEINFERVKGQLENFRKIKEQKYPWFSGKAVRGVKLFDHYKAGSTDIERPVRKVQIKNVELLSFDKQSAKEIKKYIFDSIEKVSGDFRQEKILARWREFFKTLEISSSEMLIFQIKITVSSGTYIRVLTENFDFPIVLLKLKRTRIG